LARLASTTIWAAGFQPPGALTRRRGKCEAGKTSERPFRKYRSGLNQQLPSPVQQAGRLAVEALAAPPPDECPTTARSPRRATRLE
jgi:hypothetical protein